MTGKPKSAVRGRCDPLLIATFRNQELSRVEHWHVPSRCRCDWVGLTVGLDIAKWLAS